ncbi:MAG: nucleotidyltransferase family protein [Paracoccaceae bacterium]
MLFAAGLGTRMAPLTDHCPKPLIKVAGRALIDHALDQMPDMDQTVVNLHYLSDQIRAHLSGRKKIAFSPEIDTILETGGGLLQALPLLGVDPIFTLNSDAVWTGPLASDQLRQSWDPARMDGLLLLVDPARAVGHSGAGDFLIDGQGRLTRGTGLIYSGAGIIRTDGLFEITERAFSLNRLWDAMMAKGRLFGICHQGGWCDVGRPESLPLAEAMLGHGHV